MRAGCRRRVGNDARGHEVSHHVGCGGEGGRDVAQFDMLTAEVDTHVDVA